MSDLFKSLKNQGKNYDNLDVSPAEKICIRFFTYNESKHSTKLLNSPKIKPYFEKFNIKKVKSNVLKKFTPTKKDQWSEVPILLNFDEIEPDPSYICLINYLKGANIKADEVHNFLIPLLNDVLPIYFRFFFVFTYKLKIQLEKYFSLPSNSNQSERSKVEQMIDTIDKLFWLFFCEHHQYICETLCSFHFLIDVIVEFINPLLDPAKGQLLFPIVLSVTSTITKYLYSISQHIDDPKQTQPIPVNNSPIFYFMSVLFLNINELQQKNLYLVSTNILNYLKFFSNETFNNLIVSLDENAAFKNLDFFMFQIRKILLPDYGLKDISSCNSLLMQTITALLCCYSIENLQSNKNKSHSNVSFQTISELIIQVFLWDFKSNNPNLNSILQNNTVSKEKNFLAQDSFTDIPNNCISQTFLNGYDTFNDEIFNTLDFNSPELKNSGLIYLCQVKCSENYSISKLCKELCKFLGEIFTKKPTLFNQFLSCLKDYMKENDNPILRMSLLKGLQESMNVTTIMNTLWHTESIETFLSDDIKYIYFMLSNPDFWPSNDCFITFFEMMINYFTKNPLFDNVKQYINDILSFQIQNSTPMQMTSLITAIYYLLFSSNGSEPSNRLTFIYSPKSTIFDEIIDVDNTYFVYLSSNYEKMKSLKAKGTENDQFTTRYYQILQAHIFILDFLDAFMSSSASVTYVFCQKSMTRVHHVNFLFFDKRTQEMAMQFYSKHISSKNSTYILVISLKNLLKQFTNDIDNNDVVDIFCKIINLVADVHDEHLSSLVSNMILTNFFIHLVHIVASVIHKFDPNFSLGNNNSDIIENKDSDSDPSNITANNKKHVNISPSQVHLDQSQLKTIKSLFISVLDLISKISYNSEAFIDHLTEKQQYYIDDLIAISKYVEFDSNIFNTLFLAMTGRNINDVKDMNEAEIISQVAARLFIELTYDNNFYLKSLTIIDKLTQNSVNNQIKCYVSGIFYFFIDHLFDKISDLVYKIVSNVSQSYFDNKALIKLVNKYEEVSKPDNQNINQQRQLKILQLFHKLLIEKPTIDKYSGSFFHVNDYRDQNVFKTQAFLVEYPIRFSFHFKLYKVPKDGFFKIVGSKQHKINFKVSDEKLIVHFISKSSSLSTEFSFPLNIKLFTWNFIEFSLTPKSFELSVNNESAKTNIDNLDFKWNSDTIYYSTESCIMDFEELAISHANHDLCSYSAKIVNKNLCFNMKKGEFDAKFLGPSFKYSPSFENSIRFVGGIRIILPLFNYIPTEQDNKLSEEQFLIIFDMFEHSLRKYQDQALDQHIFRILNSFLDKLNIESFSDKPGNQILQLFDIVKNPQLIKEMNAYLFSDFTLLSRFKNLLEQMFTKKKIYALQLDLSFLQAFVRISFLNKFDYQCASEYLIEVANKDKNQTQNVSYLIHFIMTNYQTQDQNLIYLSFQVLSAILNTSQFLTVFPMLAIINTKNETCQYWATEVLMRFLSLFEKDTRILIFRKNIQIVSSIDIDTALTNPQKIFYLILYYCFNEYKQLTKEEENNKIEENKKLVSNKHTFSLIQVELLSLICPMLHFCSKVEAQNISKSFLNTFRNTQFSYYEFLPLLICYISTYADFSDHNSWIELLSEIIYINNEEKVFDEILLILTVFSIIFKWNYDSDIIVLILSLLNKISYEEKSKSAKQIPLNPKIIMKILISLVSQPLLSTIRKSDYTVNNKYVNTDNIIIFKKIIEIILNDHKNWIFSVSSILPQIRTGVEKSSSILDIFKLLNKIVIRNPELLLIKDSTFDVAFSELYIFSLTSIQKEDFIDPIAEKLSKVKENQSQYETAILLFIGSSPSNTKLVSLYKSLISSRAKSNDIIAHGKAAYEEMMHKYDSSYMLKYKNSFESGLQLLSASLSRVTEKKAQNDDFQQSQFEYINIQYKEQIDRMKMHNSKVCEDLLTSLQTNQNIGILNENNVNYNHYKIYSILDGNGRHSAMKRIKHFKDHHRASEKRDQIQKRKSMASIPIDIEEANCKCLISGIIDFKLDPYEVNKPSNENLFEKSCQLVEIATVFTGKISITRGSISFDSKEANRILSSKSKDCQRFIEFNLSSLRFVFWRRFKHVLTGLEFFIRDGSSFLFQFKNVKDMQSCLKQLNDLLNSELNYKFYVQTKPSKETSQSVFFQSNFTIPWQNGEMSNYEYLFWVNMISGRSFHDISQYPVFPWILKDYTGDFIDFSKVDQVFRNLSLPVGALDESRLEMLKENMEGLTEDQRCLYNKHYMTAGFVTYYLMRCEPFTMMHIELQSGQFDYANRLFISVQSIWDVVSGPAQNEFRELVPEFFSLPNFLKNYEKYDLGKTPEGESVDNVKLPKWSTGNPSTFIALNRLALESPYVSSHINEWIDLIFGYKSRGKAAEEANNTFHPYTYPEIIDNAEIANDPCMLTAVQDWAVNYGTCAEQAFVSPHPTKFPYFIPSTPFATSSFSLKAKELNKNTIFKNPYAVSFTLAKIHRKGGGAKLYTIKFIALQHPDSIGIIKIHQGNQEKDMNATIDVPNSNDLLETNLENSIFNSSNNLSNLTIISKELCKFKTKAGTAKFLKASEMLGSLTAFNQENNLFISSAPWIDYFEVVFYNPSLKVKKKTTGIGFKAISGAASTANSTHATENSNPSFHSQPQQSCITVLACDQWAVVTGFENSSIAVWDLRNNISNFNCNSVINSNTFRGQAVNLPPAACSSGNLQPLYYIFGHSGSIKTVDVSVDLNLIVSVDTNNLVLMSFLSNGERIRSFSVPNIPMKAFIFSLGFLVFIYETQEIKSAESAETEASARKTPRNPRMSDFNDSQAAPPVTPVASSPLMNQKSHNSFQYRSDSFNGVDQQPNPDSKNISQNDHILTTIELRDLSGRVVSETQKQHRADVFCKCTTNDYSQYLMISFSMKLNSSSSCVFLYRIYDLLIVALKPINGKVLSAAFDKKLNMFVLCIEEMPSMLLKVVPNEPV